MDKRGRGGRSIKIFRQKFCCLTVPKKFIVEPFSVSLISGTEKVYASERGEEVSRFSVEDPLSHSAENFRRGTHSCFTNFGYKKNLNKRGGSIKNFRRKFFVSQCRKIL